MIIKNRHALSTNQLRKQVLDTLEAGIARVLVPAIIKSTVKYDPAQGTLTVNDYVHHLSKGRVFVIGGGKASGSMAETLEKIILPDNILAGIVICKGKSSAYKTTRIKIVEASHPVPNQKGLSAVKQILALKSRYSINENDLIICLISGGGSALMPCPVDGVSLEDKQRVTELLLRSGAEIHQVNAVRKHLSKTKGGKLGHFFSPAIVVSLILSDVVGNDLDVIASGPTSPDRSTFWDAYNALEKHDLLLKVPKSILGYLKKGCQGEVEETPKTLENCLNYIVGDNKRALEAMMEKGREMGFTPCIITAEQRGDTNAVAQLRAREILNAKYAGYNMLLIGGETTLKLPCDVGKGGRNQHYAAVSMLGMKECAGEWAVACVGTDGSDFLADVAGAIVDNDSLNNAASKGIDVKSYIDRYDSNTLLKRIGRSVIVTGITGTNVGDVIVYALG